MKRLFIISIMAVFCLCSILGQKTNKEKFWDYIKEHEALQEKLEKKSNDPKLLDETVTVLYEIVSRCSFNKLHTPLSPEEEQFFLYTYVKLRESTCPTSYGISKYAGDIIDTSYDIYRSTYDLKLIYAEANLFLVNFEAEKMHTVHRLRRALKLLEDMDSHVTFSEHGEKYIRWTHLDVSDKHRQELIQRINKILDSYSAEFYYETANSMLGYYLTLKGAAAYRHYETFKFAVDKAIEKGFPDVQCANGRFCEYSKNPSLSKALECYKAAANKGGIEGKINAARLLMDGLPNKKPDYKTAFIYLNSVKNHLQFAYFGGAYQLGRLYENGWGVKQNDSIALHYYSEAYKHTVYSANYYNEIQKKEVEIRLDSLSNAMGRIAERRALQSLENERIRTQGKATALQLTQMGCRYILLGKEEDGRKLLELAASKGSKFSKNILNKSSRYNRSLTYLLSNEFSAKYVDLE